MKFQSDKLTQKTDTTYMTIIKFYTPNNLYMYKISLPAELSFQKVKGDLL